MSTDLLFEFSVDKETNSISVRREFEAELALVWKAWTKAELIDQWWAPEGWECKTKSMEFKEGGLRHYLMRGPMGEEHWGINTYLTIELHKSFSGKDCFTDENAKVIEDYPNSDYTIAFFDIEDKTLIEHHTAYPNLEQLEASLQYGFEDGMRMAFEGLDNILR